MSSCPICLEDYSTRSTLTTTRGAPSSLTYHIYLLRRQLGKDKDSKRLKVTLSCCCNNHICNQCLYSHIKSILEEGITLNGRTSLSCPYDCGSSLSDDTVRSIFALTPSSSTSGGGDMRESIKGVLHIYTYLIVSSLIDIALVTPKIFLGVVTLPSSSVSSSSRAHSHSYKQQFYDWLILTKLKLSNRLLKSDQELLDLDLYERWSLTIAFNAQKIHKNTAQDDTTTKENHDDDHKDDDKTYYTHVTRCPSPDCPCLWLTNKPYYDLKQKNERKYSSDPWKYGGKQSFFKMAKSYLCYKPIHPREEEEILNHSGYTSEHWLSSKDFDLIPTCVYITSNNHIHNYHRRNKLQVTENNDGRLSSCPMCKHSFCNLCLQPWQTLSKNKASSLYHTNITCASYNANALTKEYVDVINAADARICPGCGTGVNRNQGCNHMTCHCGYEWCYMCECKWKPKHYDCVDRNPRVIQTCVVS